ncbi:hypothetical protein N7463_000712 [Penicillium fimorum]|uniref:CENP-V/GFA domain-containing protein n=1 Tax=Penicillium fimorum TaxID=1882269 RepID=A0A9X0CBC8_9EURO|nr:hypothetical protein N7463_000712 [Penicillium fimorum]
MASGSCYCGNVRIELTGEPVTASLCHCLDCRKLTGGPFSYNVVVKISDLKITGDPKQVSKTGDSGSEIKNYFCSECGTPVYAQKIKASGEPEEITIVRAGVFDEVTGRKPTAELFTKSRLNWVAPLEGADQFPAMVQL